MPWPAPTGRPGTFSPPCSRVPTAPPPPRIYAFGHSHLDLAWLWTREETVRKCGRTFSTQLHLMDMYPDYVFLQSQPYLYQQTKENYPELYEKIRQKVKAGQFIPEGGMWVEADTNMPCGESLIRQFLYGKKFFREEFGVESELQWLPDVFGYSGAMPQILRGCGIRYFATQKLSWVYNDCDAFPYNYFRWQGIDGSEVLSVLDRDYGAQTDAKTVIHRFRERASKTNYDRILYPYGYGDGGAGPTRDHLENLHRLKDLEGVPKCELTTPNALFRDMENGPYAPDHYVGELYFATHRGVYTSQADVKKGNRKSEFALREADVWSALTGHHDPVLQETLYKKLLFNQFHDVLPGSGIAEIYQHSRQDYQEILEGTSEYLKGLLGRPQEDAITVFNSLSWERSALIPLPQGWTGARTEDGPLTVQALSEKPWVRVTLAPFASRVLYRADAQPEAPRITNGLPVLENEYLRVEFAADGSLAQVRDKQTQRQWLARPGNQLRMFRDIPRHFDAWDLDSTHLENPMELTEPAVFDETQSGPLFDSVHYRRKLNNSLLSQTVILEKGSRRITFRTEIDWNESHKLLKVAFPFALHAEEMYNEIQYGFIKRPTHANRQYDKDRFEVCNHKWSAVAEDNRGAALLNDCKYGISGQGASLSLSLLRSPKAPDFRADQGHHSFQYGVYFWDGPLSLSGVVRQGYEMNLEPLCVSGAYPMDSLLSCSGDGIVIDTVKPAENGDGLVIRAYQSMNMTLQGRFRLALPFTAVTETDMLENPIRDVPAGDGSWTADFGPFEVKTFHITGVSFAK